jgi:hypothetical protein
MFLSQSEVSADWTRLRKVFFEFAEKKSAAARQVSQRFAYYTTAETAAKILQDKKLWMRNATTMNDFREIQHGWDCVAGALNGGLRDLLTAALDAAIPGLTQTVLKALDNWRWHSLYQTYLTCFSEHCPADDPEGLLEEHLGRLSMWRAYGQQSGVAFVMKGETLLSETDTLKVYSSPVAYLVNLLSYSLRFSRIYALPDNLNPAAAQKLHARTPDRATTSSPKIGDTSGKSRAHFRSNQSTSLSPQPARGGHTPSGSDVSRPSQCAISAQALKLQSIAYSSTG